MDRSVLYKIKKSVKSMNTSGLGESLTHMCVCVCVCVQVQVQAGCQAAESSYQHSHHNAVLSQLVQGAAVGDQFEISVQNDAFRRVRNKSADAPERSPVGAKQPVHSVSYI